MDGGQRKQPTIFLIEEDGEMRKALVSNIRGYGYSVFVAVDDQGTIERAGCDCDLTSNGRPDILNGTVGDGQGQEVIIDFQKGVRLHA